MSDKGHDHLHGYRIGTFEVVGLRSGNGGSQLVGQQTLTMDARSNAASTAVARALKEFEGEQAPTRANQSQQVLRVHEALEHGFILCRVRGGTSGDEGDIVDSDGRTRAQLTRADSLMWVSRVVFIFSLNDPRQGFVIMETKGIRCHGTRLIDRLNSHLVREAHMRMEVRNDRADAEVWNAVLRDERSYIERLEFNTEAVESSGLGEDAHVKRARLVFDLAPTGGLLPRVANALRPGRDHDAVAELVREVGAVKMPGDLTSGHATARVMTSNGRRTIRVGERSAPFTRVIERASQTSDVDFLQTIAPDVAALADPLDLALPVPLLPTEALREEPHM